MTVPVQFSRSRPGTGPVGDAELWKRELDHLVNDLGWRMSGYCCQIHDRSCRPVDPAERGWSVPPDREEHPLLLIYVTIDATIE